MGQENQSHQREYPPEDATQQPEVGPAQLKQAVPAHTTVRRSPSSLIRQTVCGHMAPWRCTPTESDTVTMPLFRNSNPGTFRLYASADGNGMRSRPGCRTTCHLLFRLTSSRLNSIAQYSSGGCSVAQRPAWFNSDRAPGNDRWEPMQSVQLCRWFVPRRACRSPAITSREVTRAAVHPGRETPCVVRRSTSPPDVPTCSKIVRPRCRDG